MFEPIFGPRGLFGVELFQFVQFSIRSLGIEIWLCLRHEALKSLILSSVYLKPEMYSIYTEQEQFVSALNETICIYMSRQSRSNLHEEERKSYIECA